MRRRTFLKKSEVLREGYIKGLKHAQRIINEMLVGGPTDDPDWETVYNQPTDGERYMEELDDAYTEMQKCRCYGFSLESSLKYVHSNYRIDKEDDGILKDAWNQLDQDERELNWWKR